MTQTHRPQEADAGERPRVVLTIAGFDPSGGAGIIADIKTILAFGCVPTAAVTSLTFQNSAGVSGMIHQTPASLRAQVEPIINDFDIAAVKTGMLPTAEIVAEVARLVREHNLPAPVIDPVMRSSSGYTLINDDAVEMMISELTPLALLITPNIPEAEALTGVSISDEDEMQRAARKLRDMGASAVLIKGGHLGQKSAISGQRSEGESDRIAVDVLDNKGELTIFRSGWIDGPPVRGTGCMLSSAIAAGVSKGLGPEDAVRMARDFVARAISQAAVAKAGP